MRVFTYPMLVATNYLQRFTMFHQVNANLVISALDEKYKKRNLSLNKFTMKVNTPAILKYSFTYFLIFMLCGNIVKMQ